MAGWIKLHRSLLDHELWGSEPFTKAQAWVDLILRANHKEAKIMIKGVVIQLKVGQQARSEYTLSKEWSWSKGKVRRYLKLLKNELMIEQQTTPLTSIISICNYRSYQINDIEGGTTNGTTVDTTGGTTSEPQTNQTRYTDKNVKNEENEKNTDMQPTKRPACPFSEITKIYNECIDKPFPSIIEIKTDKRKRLTRKFYISMSNDLDKVRQYFKFVNAKAGPWMRGESTGTWIADYEYIIKEDTIEKARENRLP